MRKIFVHFLWSLLAVVVLGAAGAFYAISKGWIGYMPPIEDLQNPINRFATQVISADGKVMGTWNYNKENRVCVDYSQFSPHIVEALVATEDVRFYEHSGIDFFALGRAVVKRGIFGQVSAGGGSTITQQLAKQLYSVKAHSVTERLMQKPIEWVIAVNLERTYTKDEIIALYLNYFDFLHNAVGIKTAANTYFGKEPRDLTVNEAATLIGLCKNPSYYNPVRHPERSRYRRNVVLMQMQKAGYITDAQYEKYSAEPLNLNFHVSDHKDGIATYFRDFLRRYVMAKKPERSDYPSWNYVKYHQDSINWETDPLYGWCNKNFKKNGEPYNVYTDGLKFYTTIDSRMQQYAEEAVRQQMTSLQTAFFREKRGVPNAAYTSNPNELGKATQKSLIDHAIKQSERWRTMHQAGFSDQEIFNEFNRKREMTVFSYHGPVDTVMTPRDSLLYTKHFLRCGFMSMDARNGHVKAYVGGPDFTFFQYDMVATGRRQIGSTIKPFLYTYAMEEGFTPCDQMLNAQPVIKDESGRTWMPRNSGSARIGEMVDLRWALTYSNNWISARLMEQLSPATLVRNMHNFGITNHIDPVISISLGAAEVSVREMVGAYSAYANNGMRSEPLYVTSICDANGNVISEFSASHTEVISEKAYAKILSMLMNVVEAGTGSRLRRAPYSITAEMGGKTGTTNSNSDAWFMGFSPELVAGAWVGGEERFIHFASTAQGQGSAAALPIVGNFLKKVFADRSLPYSQDAKFGVDFSEICDSEFADAYVSEESASTEASLEDVFD